MRSKRQAVSHSKIIETKVLRYLSNIPTAQRDWKERWDIRLEDNAKRLWVGEVKDLAGGGRNPVKAALAALAQVDALPWGDEYSRFAFVHRLNGRLENDIVAWIHFGVAVVAEAETFKRDVLGFRP